MKYLPFLSLSLVLSAPVVYQLRADEPAASAEQLKQHADGLMQASRFEDALDIYRRVLPQLSGAAQRAAQFKFAYALQRRGRYEEAVKAYRAFMNTAGAEPARRAAAQMNVGYCLQVRGKFEEAIEAYRAVETIGGAEPHTIAEARVRIGYTYNTMEEPDKAVEAMLDVLEVPLENRYLHQTAYISAGGTLQAQGRYEEAAELYRRALDISSNNSAGEVAGNRLKECRVAAAADPAFFIEPYVSLVGADAATIFWISRGEAGTGKAVVEGGGQRIETSAERTQMPGREAYRQTIPLQGLKPYTLYEYTLHCGRRTRRGTFHTARSEPGPIRFVLYGDTQTGWQRHARIGPAIAEEKPDFVLHVGDCVERGSRWDEWKVQFFDPAVPYLKHSPIWVARGNHDGGPYFPIFFGRERAPYQSFRFGDLHVMVLDSTSYMGGRRGEEQLAWLRRQLETSQARWQIVALHHPMFHTTNGDRLVGQDNFRPLIERLRPDLVLNGHYHVYTRLLPIGPPGEKPVVNVISGGGGGRVSPHTTITPIAEREVGVHHFCLFEIDGNRLEMTAKSIDGDILDRMTLVKQADGVFQREVMEKAIDPATARAVHMVYHDLQAPGRNDHYFTGVIASDGDGARITLDRNILDVDSLPKDTRLIVEGSGANGWQVDRQALDPASGELSFRAPETDLATAVRSSELVVRVTLQVGDRLLEPRVRTVRLRME